MKEERAETGAELFAMLPGLPGFGALPEQFTATGTGTHSEGVVVRFYPRGGEGWVGNFVRGSTRYNSAFLHPDGRTVIVVSGGQAYHIDPESRALRRHFGGNITDVVVDSTHNQLIFSDGLGLSAIGVTGEVWKTKRISWDGIRELRLDGESLAGEAYDAMNDSDQWVRFWVSLQTGKVKGGSYRWE